MEYKKIVLKYREASTRSHHKPGDMFVALDENSGGYPYRTNVNRCHDFKSVEQARRYPGHDEFDIVELTITIKERAVP